MPANNDARVFIGNRGQAQMLLQAGTALHCARWRYTYRHGQPLATLLRYDVSPMIEHKFDTLTDMMDDIQAECANDWSEVSYYVRGTVSREG